MNKNKLKAEYKLLIKSKQLQGDSILSDELCDLLRMKKSEDFWNMWNAKFSSKKKAKVVAGCCADAEIAGKFADYFAGISCVNREDKDLAFREKFEERYSSYIGSLQDIEFDISLVESSLKRMKKGKAPGCDSVSTEHLLYSHPIVLKLIAKLFEFCWKADVVLSAFTSGLIVPILKGKECDCTLLDSYRAITISPVLAKLFEMCVLEVYRNFLDTDKLQMGFKKDCGCKDAILSARSVINFYTSRNSTVTACILDISKAFDRVNFYGLFLKLMDRNLPRRFIAILVYWYSFNQAVVKWGSAISYVIRLRAGVRQGGVLSPMLFNIYIDTLISKLKRARYGLCFYGIYVGCILYADDVLLMANSLHEMQCMLDICDDVINELDLSFNTKKSCAIRFGKRRNMSCTELKLGADSIQFVETVRYLGVMLKSGVNFTCDIGPAKVCFYRAFNQLLYKCKCSHAELLVVHMLKSICLPILLYSMDIIAPVSSVFTDLNNVMNIACMKIFSITDVDSIIYMKAVFGINDIEKLCKMRLCKFLLSHIRKDSGFGSSLARSVMCDARWFKTELETVNCFTCASERELTVVLRRIIHTCVI
jgi:hypothetical protein